MNVYFYPLDKLLIRFCPVQWLCLELGTDFYWLVRAFLDSSNSQSPRFNGKLANVNPTDFQDGLNVGF